jgi:hypothetical protein
VLFSDFKFLFLLVGAHCFTQPDIKPKWLVVSHLDDQYHLWRDTHKEISHNFSQVEKLERRVREIGR